MSIFVLYMERGDGEGDRESEVGLSTKLMEN